MKFMEGVVSALLIAGIIGCVTLFRDVGVIQEKVEYHTVIINEVVPRLDKSLALLEQSVENNTNLIKDIKEGFNVK